ncbi:MAG: gluconolactonase, partial [Chromatiales bacterium]|nr:gluconolactonase [Chromatiales bacterium]
MTDPTIALFEIKQLGSGLKRPECVTCTAAGEIWVSHHTSAGGGVARLEADGSLHPVTAGAGAPGDFMPNGWTMEPGGSFLVANLADSGGVWRLNRDGTCANVLDRIEGQPMPPVNFVHRDKAGRIWVAVSTWRVPRDRALHQDVADGFVVLMDDQGARIVADGLGYTNEVKVDPSGEFLYANETMARRLSRYPIQGNGLGPREVVVNYIDGVIPDGLEFDEAGGVWCASVMSNRLIRVDPDGQQHIVLEDCDPAEIARGMAAWHSNEFGREHLNIGASRM